MLPARIRRVPLAAALVLAPALSASGAAAQCPIALTTAAAYPANSNPQSVAVGDVNGDGWNDVVVGYNGMNTVSVYLNNQNGTLATRVNYPTGGSPVLSLVLARMNNDAALDIVCATNFGARVLMNNGSGTFLAPTGSGSQSLRQVAVADLNGDGRLDVAAASNNMPLGVVVYLNTGGGGGGGMSVLDGGTHLPLGVPVNGVGILDYDNDSIPDIVASGAGSNGLHRFKGNGDGTFQPGVQALAGVGGQHMTLADVTGGVGGDGRADVLIPGNGPNVVHIIRNNGGGAFALETSVPANGFGSAWNCAAQDMNGDGIRDLLVPLGSTNQLAAYRGLGAGAFQVSAFFAAAVMPSQVAVGDLNNDGAPDAVVTNTSAGNIFVYLNTPATIITGQPSSLSVFRNGTAAFTVAATVATGFAWRFNGAPLVEGGHYSGVATAMLTITEATSIEAGTYDCVVSGGPCAATSSPATLSVVVPCPADVDDGGGTGTPDGGVTLEDLLYYLGRFDAGC